MTAPRDRRLRIPGQARAIAVIGAGLLLAVAATVGPLPPTASSRGASLTIRLPDAVWMVVLGLLGLSTVLLFLLQRRRRPTDDLPRRARPRQRVPPWLSALLSVLAMLWPVGLWYLITRYGGAGEVHPIDRAMSAIADLLDFLANSRKPPTSIPFLDAAVGTLLVLFALSVFALMVLVTMADRLARWWGAGRAPAGVPPVPGVLVGPKVDPRAEPDARAAIILAYGRFEGALAAARAPRAPWQTPAEFMRATAARRLPVPARPVERITALFEIARFSDRPVGADARDAACDCLDEIEAALARGGSA